MPSAGIFPNYRPIFKEKKIFFSYVKTKNESFPRLVCGILRFIEMFFLQHSGYTRVLVQTRLWSSTVLDCTSRRPNRDESPGERTTGRARGKVGQENRIIFREMSLNGRGTRDVKRVGCFPPFLHSPIRETRVEIEFKAPAVDVRPSNQRCFRKK